MNKGDGARPENLSPLALACLWEAQAARKMLGGCERPTAESHVSDALAPSFPLDNALTNYA